MPGEFSFFLCLVRQMKLFLCWLDVFILFKICLLVIEFNQLLSKIIKIGLDIPTEKIKLIIFIVPIKVCIGKGTIESY